MDNVTNINGDVTANELLDDCKDIFNECLVIGRTEDGSITLRANTGDVANNMMMLRCIELDIMSRFING